MLSTKFHLTGSIPLRLPEDCFQYEYLALFIYILFHFVFHLLSPTAIFCTVDILLFVLKYTFHVLTLSHPLLSAVFTWTYLLVVVVELEGSEQEALDLVALVTNVVLEEHYLIVGVVVVVDPGVIPINSRGEKQRMHLRDRFLTDQLDPIFVAYNMMPDARNICICKFTKETLGGSSDMLASSSTNTKSP